MQNKKYVMHHSSLSVHDWMAGQANVEDLLGRAFELKSGHLRLLTAIAI